MERQITFVVDRDHLKKKIGG